MNFSPAEQKKQLRQNLRANIESLPIVQRNQASFQACALLRSQLVWQKARSVLFYSPLPNELNISPLVSEALKSGKIISLPKFDVQSQCYGAHRIENPETDFLPGKFGIHEPKESCARIPLNHLDLALVPGVGFDPMGGRLGRGRGFYDRLLAQIVGMKCGVAFDEQMVERVPMEEHDVRLNFILTPTRWLETRVSTE